jgi:hypothetical protein
MVDAWCRGLDNMRGGGDKSGTRVCRREGARCVGRRGAACLE